MSDFDRRALQWKSIQAYGEYLPELEYTVEAIVSRRLGYDVSEDVLIPYSPHLRLLIHQFQNQEIISWEEFKDRADALLMFIRNREIRAGKWVERLDYTADDYRYYETYLPEHKEQARKMVTEFLGYAPAVENSLFVETMIRGMIARHAPLDPASLRFIRFKSRTIIKYIEVMRAEGKDAADSSPLCGYDWPLTGHGWENNDIPEFVN